MEAQLDEPDLRSYLGVIARRRWLVVVTTVVAVAVALAVSLIPPPKYEATATVLTASGNDPVSLIFGQNNPGNMNHQASAQAAFLGSGQMRIAVSRAYSGSLDPSEVFNVQVKAIDAGNNQTSNVVQLSLVSSDPRGAATLVNIYAETYQQIRINQDQENLIAVTAQTRAYLNELEEKRDEIKAPLAEITERLRTADTEGERENLIAEREGMENELRPQLDPVNSQITRLNEQLGNLAFGVNLATGGGASVLSRAGVPDTPVSPNIPLNLAIGVVFGLFLGAALAFVRDYFDDSVKTKEMVEHVTGVSALGLIPKFDFGAELVTVEHPSAPAAEAFRSLRTSVKFLGVDRQVRVVQVTSPSPGEGKTMVAVNLAIAFAQAGDRVVVVGADLRRPRMEQVLDVPLTPGLTAVLIGDVTLPQAIQTMPSVPNLSVLPAGQPPPNPSELLSGERARRLIEVLGQTYDVVIIDCPPVLPVTDSLVIGRMVDTTLLVTAAGQTSKRGLQRAVELLRQVDAPLVGSVLNSMDPGATFSSEPYRYERVTQPESQPQPRRSGGSSPEEGPTDEGGGRRFRRGDLEAEMWEQVPPANQN